MTVHCYVFTFLRRTVDEAQDSLSARYIGYKHELYNKSILKTSCQTMSNFFASVNLNLQSTNLEHFGNVSQ